MSPKQQAIFDAASVLANTPQPGEDRDSAMKALLIAVLNLPVGQWPDIPLPQTCCAPVLLASYGAGSTSYGP